ncbi:MAG: cobalamin-dependent protein [Desulfamplus sp.]|nr:cobalamin-dependent protein [Desulfamplus sp.]
MLSDIILKEFDIITAHDDPYRELAESYSEAVFSSDRRKASAIILEAVESGTAIKDIYLHVFQPSLYLIGRLWQFNIISVAQEHLFTAMTQSIMAQLYPFIMSGLRGDKKMIATCVGSELHEIGIRMVADIFEMDGWSTLFLGAGTSSKTVVGTIDSEKPHLLAISATMNFHLPNVQNLIKEVKSSNTPGLFIMVGGGVFNARPQLWQDIGADGFAMDAVHALEVADDLIKSRHS